MGSEAETLAEINKHELPIHPPIIRRELAAPTEHGQGFFDPDPAHLQSLWQDNLQRVSSNTIHVGEVSVRSLQESARKELKQLAKDYVSQYLDQPESEQLPASRIILAGHQPELFHPGVWFKNFVLSKLGQKFQAVAINLMIDNDLCADRTLRVPVSQAADSNVPDHLVACPIDRSDSITMFEGAAIEDLAMFRQAGERISDLLKPVIAEPIIELLWPQVLIAMNRLQSSAKKPAPIKFGEAIAAGRHRLERQLGLKTLELPLSRMAQTQSFSQFSWAILREASRFSEIHNQGLIEYRQVFGLRSKTHPFPSLTTSDDWVETPFWLIFDDGKRREPLFVRAVKNWLELSDGKGWQSGRLTNSDDLFRGFQGHEFQIRTRALTTTLFCRLVLSDLFIHGIGGGKYDLLTDWIATRFWGVALPQFCVVSATYKLFPQFSSISAEKIALQKQQLRDLEMNPDRWVAHLPADTILPLEIIAAVEAKAEWISGRRSGTPKERHAGIAECNQRLKEWASPFMRKRQSELRELENSHHVESALGSRDFSFCLHPVGLIQELQSLSGE